MKSKETKILIYCSKYKGYVNESLVLKGTVDHFSFVHQPLKRIAAVVLPKPIDEYDMMYLVEFDPSVDVRRVDKYFRKFSRFFMSVTGSSHFKLFDLVIFLGNLVAYSEADD